MRGSKHRWFENGKCEMKKERKEKVKRKRRNTSLILVRVWLQMVVEEFVCSALSLSVSLDDGEILDGTVSAFHVVSLA